MNDESDYKCEMCDEQEYEHLTQEDENKMNSLFDEVMIIFNKIEDLNISETKKFAIAQNIVINLIGNLILANASESKVEVGAMRMFGTILEWLKNAQDNSSGENIH